MEILKNWKEEKRSAFLYKEIAETETDKAHRDLFLELSIMAEKQADIWSTQILKAQGNLPLYQPDWYTKLIIKLVRWLGIKRMSLILAAMKVRGMSMYKQATIGDHFPIFGELESQHKPIKSSGNLRAAVFGINDGLLSNASLILGVAGAQVDTHFLLLSGVAGLLAGACSMGSGEYVSVKSQREMLEYQLALEKHELDTYPEEEAAELAAIYHARGLPREEAERMANLLIQNPEQALDTLAREELGVNPNELGSPWGAALSSFFSFTVGATVPLLPFLLLKSEYNLIISIALTCVTLFSVGATISLFTQRSACWSGLRTLCIGIMAGALTYFIGTFFGVNGG
jgi:vacuolar iron transporter family protein